MRQFEERIVCKTTHPNVKEQVSYRRAIHLQIQRYIKSLLGDTPYQAFRRMP
jgi:CRISP-associated protein Cas1